MLAVNTRGIFRVGRGKSSFPILGDDSLEDDDSANGGRLHYAIVTDVEVGHDVVKQEQTLRILLSHSIPRTRVLCRKKNIRVNALQRSTQRSQ